MVGRPVTLAALLLSVFLAWPEGQAPTAEALVEEASVYVADFQARFVDVVATEQSVQRSVELRWNESPAP